MEAKLIVRLTEAVQFDFMLFHAYSKFSGFLTNVLGCAIAFMGVILYAMNRTDGLHLLRYLLAALLFLSYHPILLKLRAGRYIRSLPEAALTIEYVFAETGVTERKAHICRLYPWEEIQRAVVTPKTIGLYYGTDEAMILPKEDFGDQFAAVMRLISSHVGRSAAAP